MNKIKASTWKAYKKYMLEKHGSAPSYSRLIIADKTIFGSKRQKCIGEEITFDSITVSSMEAFDKMRKDLIDLGAVRFRHSGARALKNGGFYLSWISVVYVTEAMKRNLEIYLTRLDN